MYEICWVCEPCPLLQSPDRQRFRGPYPCLGYAYSTSVNTTLQVACQWTTSRRRSQGNGPCKSRPAIMTTGFLQQPAKLAIIMALGRSPCGGCYWFPAQLRPAQPKGSAEGLSRGANPASQTRPYPPAPGSGPGSGPDRSCGRRKTPWV